MTSAMTLSGSAACGAWRQVASGGSLVIGRKPMKAIAGSTVFGPRPPRRRFHINRNRRNRKKPARRAILRRISISGCLVAGSIKTIAMHGGRAIGHSHMRIGCGCRNAMCGLRAARSSRAATGIIHLPDAGCYSRRCTSIVRSIAIAAITTRRALRSISAACTCTCSRGRGMGITTSATTTATATIGWASIRGTPIEAGAGTTRSININGPAKAGIAGTGKTRFGIGIATTVIMKTPDRRARLLNCNDNLIAGTNVLAARIKSR